MKYEIKKETILKYNMKDEFTGMFCYTKTKKEAE